MLHIQRYRRMRALVVLQRLAEAQARAQAPSTVPAEEAADAEAESSHADLDPSHTIDVDTITGLLMPLAAHHIFEDVKSSEAAMVDASIAVLGSLCRLLPWHAYAPVLSHYLRLVKRKNIREKILIKTLISILDAFHFNVAGATLDMDHQPPAEEDGEDKENRDDANVDDSSGGALPEADVPTAGLGQQAEAAAATRKDHKDEGRRVLLALEKDVLPRLTDLLTYYEGEYQRMRSPVALALVKLLMLLPEPLLVARLPRTLTKLVVVLRDRINSVRAEARVTLVKVAEMLGPKYLDFLIREMRHVLKRGYQLFVLANTTHAVLEAIAPRCAPGDVDTCIDDLVPIFIDDIFGGEREEREATDTVSRLPEAQKQLSYNSFFITATLISYSAIDNILDPLKAAMATTEKATVANKLQTVLENVAHGLEKNTGLAPADRLDLCYSLIAENLPLSRQGHVVSRKRDRREESIFIVQRLQRLSSTPQTFFNTNAHLLVDMGLQLLVSAFRRGVLATDSADSLALIDGFVPKLVDCLFSKHNRVLAMAARVWSYVLPLSPSLPSLHLAVDRLSVRLIKLMQRSGDSETASNVLQNSCQALAALIRECNNHTLPTAHLKVVLSLVRANLENTTRQRHIYTLLRAILNRKMEDPDLYDLMEEVSRILVQSQAAQARSLSRAAFLAFILNYSMSKKRLQHHIRFLAANLDYDWATGRESVLETLLELAEKLPGQLLEPHADLLFVPLVMQTVNTDSAHGRRLCLSVLDLLLKRCSVSTRDRLFTMSLAWFGKKPALQRAALYAISAVAGAEGAAFEKRAMDALNIACEVVLRAEDEEVYEDGEDADGAADNFDWDILYLALGAVRKIEEATAGALNRWAAASGGEATLESFWEQVASHLLYSHTWVRQAAADLFGTLFATLRVEDDLAPQHVYFSRKNQVFALTKVRGGGGKGGLGATGQT